MGRVSLSPGTRLGKYTVRRKLAEGGMAEIFLCAAEGPAGFAKEVVVKRVRPFLTDDPAFISMFIDEARLASRLTHPNVVQIFDFDRHDDTYYLAMEYVRGASLWELRERCRAQGRSMPPLLVAHVGVEVARALTYAHQLTDGVTPLNVVHRDVTPHNVLISYEGAVKLGDFGIARAGKASTAPGMLKGKFAYMAPEQARGERVDGRCDVFALGVVLWELLTGGRPFEAESDLGVLRAVQQRAIPPPRRLNPEVPETLDAAIMRALERDLDRRWPDARSFGRAIEQAVMQHRKAPEDTDIAAFLLEVLGPPTPTSSTVPATAPAQAMDPPLGAVEAISISALSAPAPSGRTPPESHAASLEPEASGAAPWGVSEPTPVLRRRSTSDAPAAAFLLDGPHPPAAGPGPADPAPHASKAEARSSHTDTAHDATWALNRGTRSVPSGAADALPMTKRPKAGRIAVVCVSALVMAGPALLLMDRVTRGRSGKGVAKAVLSAAPPRDGAPPETRSPSPEPAAVASPGDGAEPRPFAGSRDLSERAPSLTPQGRSLLAESQPASPSAPEPMEGLAGRGSDTPGGSASDAAPGALPPRPPADWSPPDHGSERAVRRASAPARGSGVLVVHVFPEAQLEINGEARGRVRGRQSFRLPLGAHTVRLVHPHRSERFEVELSQAAPVTLRFNAFHAEPR